MKFHLLALACATLKALAIAPTTRLAQDHARLKDTMDHVTDQRMASRFALCRAPVPDKGRTTDESSEALPQGAHHVARPCRADPYFLIPGRYHTGWGHNRPTVPGQPLANLWRALGLDETSGGFRRATCKEKVFENTARGLLAGHV
ncbi:MAG: hypothetical protein AAF999_03325 [Pseudomonadota bacterium]